MKGKISLGVPIENGETGEIDLLLRKDEIKVVEMAFKEIERLKNELEVSRNNEETYRLEMLDITKRLGLDKETLFDDVKDKAERLNNIINELEKWLDGNSKYKELFEVDRYYQEVLNKLKELKESKGEE